MSAQDILYSDYIAKAKATKGGHLHVERGGYTLYFDEMRLSGYDADHIKTLCIELGLPVIDSRGASFDEVAKLSVRGPMIAVNADPDPRPWDAFSYAPLAVVAAAYRRIGAEVFNIEEADFDESDFEAPADACLAILVDGWLAYVRRARRRTQCLRIRSTHTRPRKPAPAGCAASFFPPTRRCFSRPWLRAGSIR